MGLTTQSTGMFSLLAELTQCHDLDAVVALAGNPNTGKSTVFNALTGLKQHTGNWPGKTVLLAKGRYQFNQKQIMLVDLPGTYSLLANSADEKVARDFICFGRPAATIVVADATCLERNLNLALQVMEMTDRVVLCLNLIDEAERKRIQIDVRQLERELGIPVIPTAARERVGLRELMEAVHQLAFGQKRLSAHPIAYPEAVEQAITAIQTVIETGYQPQLNSRWLALRLLDGDPAIVDQIIQYLNQPAELPDQLQPVPTGGVSHVR